MKKKLDKQKIKSLHQKQHTFSAINQVVAQPFAVFLMLVKCIQEVRAMVASICWFTAVRSFLRSTAVFILEIVLSIFSYNLAAVRISPKGKVVNYFYADNFNNWKRITEKNNSSLYRAYTYLYNYYINLRLLLLPEKRKIGYNKTTNKFV
jgi:hypothetical protein